MCLWGKSARIVISYTVGPLYTIRDKPNRAVKCPHREPEGEGDKEYIRKKRQREQEEAEYVESMRKEDTRQHEEEGDNRSIR